jgi:hypothetical protein
MNLSNRDVNLGQNMFESSATAKHALGTRGVTPDGRVFRYAQAGAVDLIAGKLVQSAAVVAGHQTLVPETTGAMGIGATSLKVTCASTVAAGFYAEGYAIIASGAGQGYLYSIDNHPAVSTGAVGVFQLYSPEDALQVAITVTSTVTLVANKYRSVITVPINTATGLVLGVAPYIIVAAQFGWIQTWGPAAVLTNDASAMGQLMNGIAASCGRAAGISSPAVTACYIVGQIIGQIFQTGVAGQFCVIDLRISP